MVQMLRICQSSRTSYLHPLHRYLPRCCENYWGSFLDDVGPRAMISFNSVFYFRFYKSLCIRLPSRSPRQCSQWRLTICANFGGLASADLGNIVLELVEDLCHGVTRVWGNSGLGVWQSLTALSTRPLRQSLRRVLGEFSSWR
jgi:hypothetical protein